MYAIRSYYGSLQVLKHIASQGIVAKSGIMLGVGETRDEVLQALHDLRSAGVSVVTIGQYLPPGEFVITSYSIHYTKLYDSFPTASNSFQLLSNTILLWPTIRPDVKPVRQW